MGSTVAMLPQLRGRRSKGGVAEMGYVAVTGVASLSPRPRAVPAYSLTGGFVVDALPWSCFRSTAQGRRAQVPWRH
jgi:hypothetical protein